MNTDVYFEGQDSDDLLIEAHNVDDQDEDSSQDEEKEEDLFLELDEKIPSRRQQPHRDAKKIRELSNHDRVFSEDTQRFHFFPPNSGTDHKIRNISVRQIEVAAQFKKDKMLCDAKTTLYQNTEATSAVQQLANLTLEYYNLNANKPSAPANLPFHKSSTIKKHVNRLLFSPSKK